MVLSCTCQVPVFLYLFTTRVRVVPVSPIWCVYIAFNTRVTSVVYIEVILLFSKLLFYGTCKQNKLFCKIYVLVLAALQYTRQYVK